MYFSLYAGLRFGKFYICDKTLKAVANVLMNVLMFIRRIHPDDQEEEGHWRLGAKLLDAEL